MDAQPPSLVGRERERVAIDEAVGRLADGAVCVEFVGEPGIGKTTMLAWLAHTAATRGARVLAGRASEFERDVPFALVVDALDRHLGEADDRWARSLDASVTAELAAIFPALRAAGFGAARSASPTERFRGHRAVRVLLERLARTRPLVLALDDVHWADPSSLELVGALLRRAPDARVLIALAYRPHQAPPRLLRELATATREGMLTRIELGPLSTGAAEALLGQTVSRRDRELLLTESGGNPFYLRQLARGGDRAQCVGDLGAGVPAAVVASLLGELDGVSRGARQLARAAAVAGDPFDLDLAAQIGNLARPVALAGIDELVSADLVRSADEPLMFGFRHPLVRRAIYESAPSGWRVSAHARAADAMARRGDPVVVRAHHVERSAEVGDRGAIELLAAAAETALVPAAAAQWLKAALRVTRPDDPQRLGLLCRRGEALAAAGLLDDSHAALVAALACWPPGQDADARMGLLVVCAVVERLLGRHEQSSARLARAAHDLDDAQSRAGVMLAIELATQSIVSTDYQRACGLAATAYRRATALGDGPLLASAAALHGIANCLVCDLEGAEQRIAEASELLATLTDAAVAQRPEALYFLGWAERFVDRYDEAGSHFGRGIAVARTSGRGQLYVELMAGRSFALAAAGRLAAARTVAGEAVEAARLSESAQPLAWALMVSCFASTEAGMIADAVRDGREAVALEVDESILSQVCWVTLAVALADAGKQEEALALIESRAHGPELPRLLAMMRPWACERMTRAALDLGHVERAAEWARHANAIIDGLDCELPRALADRAAASVLLAEAEAPAAAELALVSAVRADAVGACVEAGRSRLLAGRALAAAGLRDVAGEQLRAAEAQLASCGAGRAREECVRALRRIGLRVARAGLRGDPTTGGAAALSGRELEVAKLVRDRHTNREIADRLFLSEKTVESHLRSVFVKLGVTSRRDVARALDASSR